MFEQVLFIVWRESVEAILVVGIAYAWLKQSRARVGLRYLWLGVAGGLVLAGLMGAALMGAATWLTGQPKAIFEAVMVLAATVLIVQMVMWMRAHGRTLKSELESGLSQSMAQARYWGVAILVAIAVAREGSETVVFLYGIGLAKLQNGGLPGFLTAATIGFALALITFWLLQAGSRLFSWRLFFRLTETLLLLLAAALLVSGTEKLIGLGFLPAGPDPLWNTSAWLNDGTGIGGLLASFVGYRARPAFCVAAVYVMYWAVVWGLLRWQRHRQAMPQRNGNEHRASAG